MRHAANYRLLRYYHAIPSIRRLCLFVIRRAKSVLSHLRDNYAVQRENEQCEMLPEDRDRREFLCSLRQITRNCRGIAFTLSFTLSPLSSLMDNPPRFLHDKDHREIYRNSIVGDDSVNSFEELERSERSYIVASYIVVQS